MKRYLVQAAGRVLRAPGLLVVILLLHLVLGAAVGRSVRGMVGTAMGPFAVLADGHFFYGVIQVLFENRSIMPALVHVLAGSAVIGLVFWTVLAAGVVRRLSGKVSLAQVAATGVLYLPSMLVITFWHLIPKAILLGISGGITAKLMKVDNWGLAGLALTLLVLAFTTCALDLARCAVVLHSARRFSLRTALRGYRQAFRRRRVLAASMAASAGQWACVIGMLWIGLRHPESAGLIWVVRGLSIVGVFCALCRIAVATQAGPYLSEPGPG